ncbi:MAG: alpha-amylase family glycosyl hydrolase [Prochlorotrichaceae cyanobacterium]|jgi:glycosidase
MKVVISLLLCFIFCWSSSPVLPAWAQPVQNADTAALPLYTGRGNLANDVLYYIQVDRFADGNPDNNIPLAAFPLDETVPERERDYNEANQVLLPYLYDPSHRYINLYWGGDLAGITQKLDYLQGLGITKLVLSPIQDAANGLIYNPWQNGYLHDRVSPEAEHYDQFYAHASAGFNRSWTKDWWEIDEHLADENDRFQAFARLLNEAHKRDIGIILEFNLNHTSPYRGFDPYPSFDPEQYQQWLTDQGAVYKTGELVAEYVDSETKKSNPQNWFHEHLDIDYNRPTPEALEQGSVDGLPDLNHQNPAVYKYLLGAIKFWLSFNQPETPIAGLYLPAIPNVPLNFWQDLETIVADVNPQAILIGDYGDGGYRNEKSIEWYKNTKNFDLVNYSLSIAARRFFGNDRGWDGRTVVLREHALGKSGQYYNDRLPQKFLKFMLNPSQSLEIPRSSLEKVREEEALAWINFLEAANQTRLLTYYPKMTETAYASALKFLFLSPGVPLLFYGVETGLAVPYHIDHRSPFGAGGDPFNEPMMIWPEDEGWSPSLYHLTQQLGHLRRDYPLLRYGQTHFLFPQGSHPDKDLFMLRDDDRCLTDDEAEEPITACAAILYAYSTEGGDFQVDLDSLTAQITDQADPVTRIENLESQQILSPAQKSLSIHLDPEASQVFTLAIEKQS